MPRLIPGLRPKSSALTIEQRVLTGPAAPRAARSFRQPVVRVLGGGVQSRRPAEPLEREMQPAAVECDRRRAAPVVGERDR